MIDRPIIISQRIKEIRRELGESQLIAVTKYSDITDVLFAYEASQKDFGENRVNDLAQKAEVFDVRKHSDVRWHFIGHLQSNKVRDLLKIPNLFAIHSVDSLKILEELVKRKNDYAGNGLNIFLQFNTSNESEKTGFESIEELSKAVKYLLLHESTTPFKFMGLMTLGTIRTEDAIGEAHRCFGELLKIKKSIESEFGLQGLKLSMGMSSDYKVALEYHSDYVRIGTSIFK